MGSTASTAPAPTGVDSAGASRRRSSILFFRSNHNTPSGDSSNFTSRGSVVEPGSPQLPPLVSLAASEGEDATLEDLQHCSHNGTTESTFSTSNRSLLGGLKRRLSNTSVLKQQPAAVTELLKELQLVRRNIFSNKPWIDGLWVMWIVLSNTVTSVLVAWLMALIYAVGSPFSPLFSISRKPPTAALSPSDSLLYATTVGAQFVAFACLSHATVKCFILAERLQSVHVAMRHSFRRTLVSYLRVAIHVMVIATGLGASFMAVVDQLHVAYPSLGRVQLLVLGIIYACYIDYAMRNARRFRRRLVERVRINSPNSNQQQQQASTGSSQAPSAEVIGAALDSSAATVSATRSLMAAQHRRLSSMSILTHTASKTLLQKMSRGYRSFAVISIGAMFAYMHLTLFLRLRSQWEISLVAAFSLALKIAIQEATKRLYLDAARKPSARSTHMIMTVPTIMVDAQIRMALVHFSLLGKSQSSSSVFTSSFIIVVCKILFRLAKILRLRHTIKHRLTQSKGMHRILRRVNSKLAARDIAVARAEYAQFLDWKNHKLRLHAAEVYADMHGEYISIGLVMAVVFCLSSHPMYQPLRVSDVQIGNLMVSALVQLATGVAFDYIASVVEGVHEVPLYESIGDEGRGLRVFMHVLLGAVTVVNVGVVAVFLLQPAVV